MKRIAELTLALFLVTGCASQVKQAEQAMTEHLPRQDGLALRGLETFPGGVTCGEWKGKSLSGEYNGFQPFLVRQGVADSTPSEQDQRIFCREDQVGYYSELTGISPISRGNKGLVQVLADFETIERALLRYEADNYLFPDTRQGLDALLASPQQLPAPRNYQGPYIESLPVDPWGNPYHYESTQWGGVRGTYRISTLGADGAEGGTGDDADIDSNQARYLNHMLGL